MRPFFFLPIFFVIQSCNQTEHPTDRPTAPSQTTSHATSAPQATVLKFLQWYKDHGRQSANNLVLNVAAGNWDSTKFYAVNFPATEIYLTTLTSTQLVSAKYAYKWRSYFEECDKNFKANPQNDGPPEGFDYDFVLFSQEDPGLDELSKTEFDILQQTENFSEVIIKFPSDHRYKYSLTRHGPLWVIDDIAPIYK